MNFRLTPTLLFVSFCTLLPATSLAFSINTSLARHTSSSTSSHGGRRLTLASSREEEIAKLEEQLRKLKEESAEEPVAADMSLAAEEGEATESVALTSDDYVGRGPAKRPVQPMEEMMSEAWKAQDDNSASEGGGITGILAAIALVVFLGFFSQIPVGQEDLTKYQAIKTSTSIDLGDINPVKAGDF